MESRNKFKFTAKCISRFAWNLSKPRSEVNQINSANKCISRFGWNLSKCRALFEFAIISSFINQKETKKWLTSHLKQAC